MPSSPNYVRDYKQEYKQNQSSKSEIKKRSNRNKARRKLKKLGRNIKGKDVDHKNTNANDNSLGNLRTQSPSENRSFKRTFRAGKKK